VQYLAEALIEHFTAQRDEGLAHYSARCLRRVWRAERFSRWLTHLLHAFPEEGPMSAKLPQAELDYLLHSEAGLRSIAENYVGLPVDFGAAAAGLGARS
jgi:p-hydroxybenzoate 3-monooxygenase